MAIGDKIKDYLNQKIQDFTGNFDASKNGSMAQKFWTSNAGDALVNTQNRIENRNAIPDYTIPTNDNDMLPVKGGKYVSNLFGKGAVGLFNQSAKFGNTLVKGSADLVGNYDNDNQRTGLLDVGKEAIKTGLQFKGMANPLMSVPLQGLDTLISGKEHTYQNVPQLNQAAGLYSYTNPLTDKFAKAMGATNFFAKNAVIGLGNVMENEALAGLDNQKIQQADRITAFLFPAALNGATRVLGYAIPKALATTKFMTQLASMDAESWVVVYKDKTHQRSMPIKNIIKYLRGEMTGGRLDDYEVKQVQEFVKKNPIYYYASLLADEGGFAKPGAFVGKDADKIPGELLNNDIAGQVFMELDNAYAGSRNATENGTVGIKSGFPQWVPENLREKKLFEKVYRYLVDDTTPPKNNKKEWELYGVIHSRLRRLNGIVDEPITSPKGVEVPQKMQATNTSLPGQRAYPDASTTSPQGAKPMQALQSVGSKVEVPYTNNISPNVKFLKAGRMQLPDGTYVGPKPPKMKVASTDLKTAVRRPYIDNAPQPITQSEQRVMDMANQQPMLPSGRRTLPDGSPVYDPRQAPRPRRPVSEQGQFQQQAPGMAYSMFRQNEDRIGTGFQDFSSRTLKQPLQQTELPRTNAVSQQSSGGTFPPNAGKQIDATQTPQGSLPQKSLIDGKESLSSDTNITQASSDPVQKIVNALGGAKSLRNKQDLIYSAERAKRAGAINAIGSKIPGEAGFNAQKSAARGALEKVEFETLRKELKQPDIDELFNRIEGNGKLLPFEKMTAKSGLSKLLGVEGGYLPTPSEVKLLEGVFGADFTQAVMSKRSTMQKVVANLGDALNIPRALMATFDMSAPLRQGIFLIGRPKQWVPATKDMFKYFFNQKSYDGLLDNIHSRPTYPAMKQAKLALTDLGEELNSREESFMSKIAERIPVIGGGVRASNRAYSGFLNKLRADVFDDIYKTAEKTGVLAERPGVADDIAKFVNSATGRGKFGSQALEQALPALNGLLFSPRLLASRLNLLDPTFYVKLDPLVRKEAIKSLLTFAGTGMTVLTLAELAGAEVGTDPRSADFGKIKIGNTRVDTWGGFQQYFRLAGQLITGQKINSQTGKLTTLGDGITAPDRYDLLLSFLESKQAPIFTFARDMLKGKDAIGNDLDLPVEVTQRFIPMVIQDAYDIYKDGGSPLLALPAIFGAGTQTYGKQMPYTSQTASGKPTIKYRGIPGLPEDIVNSVRGTPASDIPQDQWGPLLEANDKKTKEDVTKQQMKEQIKNGGKGNVKFQTSSKGVQYTQQDDKLFYVDSDSSIKEIDLKLDFDRPKPTSNVELNKTMMSTFKSSLTSQKKDVVKLFELGILDEQQAGSLINKIQGVYNAQPKTSGSSGGGKVSMKSFSPAKVTSLKAKRTAPIKLKAIGLSKGSSTDSVKLSGRQKRAVPQVSEAQLNQLRKPKLS